MTVLNGPGNRWTVIAETTPSGVSSVVHTGMDDYDWVMAEFSNVEASLSSFISIEIGYGATPTYASNFYLMLNTIGQQVYGNAQIFMNSNTARTTDRSTSLVFPNMGRNFTGTSTNIKLPFYGSAAGVADTEIGHIVGLSSMFKVPLTAVRYKVSAGNMQGTGAVIRTWGYR